MALVIRSVFELLGAGCVRWGRCGAVAVAVGGLAAAACNGSSTEETPSRAVSDSPTAQDVDRDAGTPSDTPTSPQQAPSDDTPVATAPSTNLDTPDAAATEPKPPHAADAAVVPSDEPTPTPQFDAGAPLDAATPLTGDGTLVIPMRPVSESGITALLDSVAEPDVGLTSSVNPEISFGWGPDYPTRVRFTLQNSIIALLDAPLLFGPPEPLVLTAVSSDSPEVAVSFVDGSRFDIEVMAPGTFTIQLEGETDVEDEGIPKTWSIEVTVKVRQVASLTWRACGDAPHVLSGAGFRSSLLQVWDEFGEQLQLSNASYNRPVTISVEARPGTALSTIDGLAHLVATGPEQRISVKGPQGEISSFELIGIDAVDGLEGYYYLCAPWTRGLELETGKSVSVSPSREEPGRVSVTPYLMVGGQRVCSVPPVEAFELEAGPDQTCSVLPQGDDESSCGGTDGSLPSQIEVYAAGECSVHLSAPNANGGAGISTTLDYTFGAVTR